MTKILVALEEKSSFANDLVTLATDCFSDPVNQLFIAFVVKDLAYTSNISAYVKEASMVDNFPEEAGFLYDEIRKKTEVISEFEKAAKSSRLRYQIYNDFKITAHELVKQTMYADLLVISYQVFFNHVTGKPDTSLLYQILKGSKCPVLILPEDFEPIKNVILTYDGKESSVYAIRAFSNLFEGCVRNKIATILTVTPSVEEEIKNEKLLMELVKQHFNNVGLQLLYGPSTSKEILHFAENSDNPLVVMGAYGRSTISNLIIPSVARRIIEKRKVPLFIAHR